jgi:hypothetical protein
VDIHFRGVEGHPQHDDIEKRVGHGIR